MAIKERYVEFGISKNEFTGRATVTALVPQGTSLEDVGAINSILFEKSDILERVGLGSCPNCLSGLDAIIMKEQFEDVFRYNF